MSAEHRDATRRFLEQRFARDAAGQYQPHQPVHGLGRGGEGGELLRVARTCRLLQWLAALQPRSLLDLGAGEGYIANLVRLRHGCPVLCNDLSLEACRRAAELYSLPAIAGGVYALPLRAGCADVVLLSEVFEHLDQPLAALAECLRLARRFFVLTTQEFCAGRLEQRLRLALRELDQPHAELNFLCRADLRALFGSRVALAPQFRRSLLRSADQVEPAHWAEHAAWLARPPGWRAAEGIIAVVSVTGEPVPEPPLAPERALLELLIAGPPVAPPVPPPWDWLDGVSAPVEGGLTIDASGFAQARPAGLPAWVDQEAAGQLGRRLRLGHEPPDLQKRLYGKALQTMERLGHLTSTDPWPLKLAWLQRRGRRR